MGGRKLSWLPAGAGLAGLGLVLGLAAVASQGGEAASSDFAAPDAEAPPANRPPLVGVRGGAVRAGESLVLAAYASDMESEAVHLEVSLDLKPGQSAPSWLDRSVWTADLSAQPILRIPLSPPADAETGTYSLLVGATDSGGLTSWRRMALEVLPPAGPAPSAGASPDSSGATAAAFSKASPAASATADSPSLNLSVSPASMAEGTSGDIVVSATLMGVSMVPGMDVVGALQVSGTATAGTDYTLTGTKSVTIPAGSATLTGTRTLKLSALADELRREDDETVKLKVTQVTRGTEVLPLSSTARTSVTITNVYAKPSKVTGVSAEAAPCGSKTCPLKVSWDAPAASPPLTEQFVQQRRADKPDADWTRMDVSASATEAVVTGLQPGRRYHVRVRARNKVGKSGWSDAAAANTAPLVTVSADDAGVASIGEGNAKARIRLTGSAKAKGGGTLTGRWHRVYPNPNSMQDEIVMPVGSSFAMASKQDYRTSPSSDTPEERIYRLEVTHLLSGDSTVGSADVALRWQPKVILSASPSSVPEDGGFRTVTVKAKLTGKSVGSESKSVSVKVKGGTATEGTDFAAVSGFTISIPGGARKATGTFRLTPTADTTAEGGETVKVKGTATEGADGPELKVRAAEVWIEDEQFTLSVSPAPTKGKVTGTGIDCGAGTSGDCSEAVTKSASVTLTASPAAGYVFKEWEEACSLEKGASCTVEVSGATTVKALFRRPRVTVEVSPAAGGSVTGSGIDCGSGTTDDCSERVSGGSIALTASPASGYSVSGWSGGGCSGTGTTCTATVTVDTTVTVTFTQQPAPAAPSSLTASPSDGQVALSWTDPGDATISGYELRYKAGSAAYGSWADISGSDADTTSHTVTGLTNGTVHSFDLRAENSTGSGASATVSATPDAVPGSVTSVTAAATGAAAASLTWAAPTAGGTVVSYEVSGSGTIAVSGTSATVTGLSQATDYKWTVKAVNASGSSAATESNTIQIPHLPGLVTDLLAAAASGSSATLAWTAPAVTTGEGAAASYAVSGDGTIVVSGTTATITGLSKNTDYSWTVAAVNVSGTGSGKASDSIRIPHAPGPVTGLSAAAESSVQAKLTWTAPAATATTGAASSYEVSGDGTIVVSGASAVVTGLTAGSAYTWTVAAVNVSGASSTASVSLTMPTAVTLTVARSPSAGGSVAGSESGAAVRIIDCGTDCTESVNSGTVVNLTATAASGYRFKDWTGCDSANGRACAQTLGADETVTANFEKVWTLTAAASPDSGGKVVGGGIKCGEGVTGTEVCSKVLAAGDVVLTATAASGHRFKDWTGCDSANGSVCTQTLGADETVTANFVQQHTLTVKRMKHAGYVTGNGINCGAGTGRTLCSVTLDRGTVVTLEATAHDHYRFSDWLRDCSGSISTCTVTMDGDKVVNLRFWVLTTLRVSEIPNNGGYVTGTGISCGYGGRTTCEREDRGSVEVLLTATAAPGFRFDSWSGCPRSGVNGAQCTTEISNTVTAYFIRRWTLTAAVSPAGGGSVTGVRTTASGDTKIIDCGTDCSEVVDANTSVKLTASPATNYQFDSWTGCDSANGSACTQTVDSNETVTANFSLVQHKLTVGSASHGYVTGNGISCGSGTRTTCMVNLLHGTSVVLKATSDANYKLNSWPGCPGGAFSKANSTCSFTINADTIVSAPPFEKVKHKLEVKPHPTNGYIKDNNGSVIDIDCSSGAGKNDCIDQVADGSGVSLTAHPDEGYKFSAWTGKCSGKATATCTFTMNAPAEVGVTFVKKKHKLTVGKSTKGRVTWGSDINCGSGAGRTKCVVNEVEHNKSVSLAATPNTGYKFEDWSGCPDINDTEVTPCTFSIKKDETVTPNFVTTLVANAGGPYTATQVGPHIQGPFGTLTIPVFFTQTVTASATGGVRLARSPWYTFDWEGAVTTGASAYYVLPSAGSYSKKVEVTDRLNETAEATATINAGRSSGAGGASGASDDPGKPFAVPVGGVLRLIWGGGGSVTAVSNDASVAGVSVDGKEITVSGVSAGIAQIVMQTDSGEFQVPVQVGDGGNG